MSALILRPIRLGPRFGDGADTPRRAAMPRIEDLDSCGGERIIDFAICLIVAAAVVGLLLLAL